MAGLLFGVGAAGVGWLARLARSGWFAGLEPRAEDLAAAGGFAQGQWAMPTSRASGEEGDIVRAAEAFFTSASLPSAWYAAVAIPSGMGLDERLGALGLIGALRERRDPSGRKLTVVVTLEAAPGPAATGMFVRRLLERGAFVVRNAATSGDHLHHLPLRAAVRSRRGQMIGVDLADYLHTWRPGSVADLHVVPFAGRDAELALCGLPASKPGGQARALNVGFHLDPCAPGQALGEIDRFATRCCEMFLTSNGSAVFTNTERLDGKVGSADLLVIYDGPP